MPVLMWAFSMSAQVNPVLQNRLNHTLDSMQVLLNIKGLNAALVTPDGNVWAKGAGISAEFPADSMKPNYISAIGSVNKTLTAAAVLQLVDEGLLGLDDSLYQWLDTFPFINPDITVRQLLRHQSGIYDVITNPDYQPTILMQKDSIWALEDVIKTFVKAPLFAPGAGWSYSNTNYILLGMLIKKVCGQTYYEACRQRFIEPLNLSSMVMRPFEPVQAPVAHLWLDLDGNGTLDDGYWFFEDWNSWYSTAGPCGSYYSAASDIARWMQTYMRGDLLSPGLMTQVRTTVSTQLPGGTKYGLGLMERYINGLKAWGHGGDAGYSASVWYFPAKDISIAVLNNDNRRTSWSLAPIVSALLRKYTDFMIASGTNETALSSDRLDAFPNPFTDHLNVSLNPSFHCDGKLELQLTDIMGNIVMTNSAAEIVSCESEITWNNLAELPQGIYVLELLLNGRPEAITRVAKSG